MGNEVDRSRTIKNPVHPAPPRPIETQSGHRSLAPGTIESPGESAGLGIRETEQTREGIGHRKDISRDGYPVDQVCRTFDNDPGRSWPRDTKPELATTESKTRFGRVNRESQHCDPKLV